MLANDALQTNLQAVPWLEQQIAFFAHNNAGNYYGRIRHIIVKQHNMPADIQQYSMPRAKKTDKYSDGEARGQCDINFLRDQ